MKPADFHPDAAAEAREAASRYDGIQLGLGDEFRNELSAILARIRDNPRLFATIAGTMRQAQLERFPYSLIFEELSGHIWIAAVAHHSRHPGYWSRRRAT